MSKRFTVIMVLGLLTAVVSGIPFQANFIQCIVAVNCDGTDNNDVINGTSGGDGISSMDGDDIIFGGDGPELINGGNGNDILFGGLRSDELFGNGDNDIILPGPDDTTLTQIASGNDGNDKVISLVGETTYCLLILDSGGLDVVTLIGFGPYIAEKPFGQSGFGNAFILLTDPIAGGFIAIAVSENDDTGVETVHGMPTPNATIVGQIDLPLGCGT